MLNEVRCPSGPGKLLAKMRAVGEQPKWIDGWAVEFACYDCAKEWRKSGKPVKRVLHRFDFTGECVETLIQE